MLATPTSDDWVDELTQTRTDKGIRTVNEDVVSLSDTESFCDHQSMLEYCTMRYRHHCNNNT
jgi:hypothetical protein